MYSPVSPRAAKPTLFDVTHINGLELANRFVRSATWTGLGDQSGSCTPRLVQRMVELAKGEVGLIITGHVYVQKSGQAGPWQLGIDRKSLIPGLRRMTDAVHEYGGKIIIQLSHAGIYAVPSLTGLPAPAVSKREGLVTHEVSVLTAFQIENLATVFARAARHAVAARFDGVQIHMAHGYLLNQFLSPGYNHRKDRYGGCIENRAAAPLAVIQRVRQAVGADYPVLIKLNTSDFWPEGIDLSESIKVAASLQKAGVDAIELSGGTRQSGKLKSSRTGIRTQADEAYFREELRAFRKDIAIPLIIVGGIRSHGVAEQLIIKEGADYIAMCRPFICEPDLVKRWKSGDIRKSMCVSDGGCLAAGLKGGGIYCVRRGKNQGSQ